MNDAVLIISILGLIVSLYFFFKSKLNQIKQLFCKHTFIPSTKVGHVICIDCLKLKPRDEK